jgi:hypothetical protein
MYFDNLFEVTNIQYPERCIKTTDAFIAIKHIHENYGINHSEFTLQINGTYVNQGVKEMIIEIGLDAYKLSLK